MFGKCNMDDVSFFHITNKSAFSKIERDGLIPNIGNLSCLVLEEKMSEIGCNKNEIKFFIFI